MLLHLYLVMKSYINGSQSLKIIDDYQNMAGNKLGRELLSGHVCTYSFPSDNTSTSSFKDCVTFLHFIDYQTAKLTHLDDDTNKPHPLVIKIINNVITHLNNIIILLYPLDQFLSSSMEMSSQAFHLFLHLLWCNISVLYRIVLYTTNCKC